MSSRCGKPPHDHPVVLCEMNIRFIVRSLLSCPRGLDVGSAATIAPFRAGESVLQDYSYVKDRPGRTGLVGTSALPSCTAGVQGTDRAKPSSRWFGINGDIACIQMPTLMATRCTSSRNTNE